MGDRQPQRQQVVQKWLDSGLSAERFGAQHGLPAATLRVWKHRIGHSQLPIQDPLQPEALRKLHRPSAAHDPVLPLVELRTTHTQASHDSFELELSNGRRLRIPASFEADSLRKLLFVLEQDP